MRLISLLLVKSERCQRPLAILAAIALATGLITSPSLVAGDRDGDHDRDRGDGRHHSSDFRIKTLSTKPHLVSGGDVLVRIDVARGVPLHQTRVELNSKSITGVFHVD